VNTSNTKTTSTARLTRRLLLLATILIMAGTGMTTAARGEELAMTIAADDVLHFWFVELQPKDWWKSDKALDAVITGRFGKTLELAAHGGLSTWRQSAGGRLAEVIVLDQFSRNIHRGTAAAFAHDSLALSLAQNAVAAGIDRELPVEQRRFLYMPYMHSETASVHEQAMTLFATPGLEQSLAFERRHKAVIDRFGRYPHRNAVLGRESTPAEIELLKQPGSSF
jgi:uncharacterized protein (DUF924 family)